MLSADFLEDLKEVFDDVWDYIENTYGAHYGDVNKVQLIDLWESAGIANTMFKGDITKYALRYGKKDGKNKKDLMKILHYTLLLLYLDHYAQGKDEGSRET